MNNKEDKMTKPNYITLTQKEWEKTVQYFKRKQKDQVVQQQREALNRPTILVEQNLMPYLIT